jgi:NitT/TauT family transport system substrate-binding protein
MNGRKNLWLMLAAGVALAGCGGAAAPASSPPAAPSSAAAKPSAGADSSAASAKPAASAAPSAAASAKPAGSGAASAAAKPAASGLTRIAASHPDGGAHLPLWYAQEKGLFAKYGLDVDIRPLGGGPPSVAALQAGETKIADTTGSTIAAADAQGADIVALATLDPVYPYVLEVPASIQNAQDLKGKGISVRAIGDATDVAARAALRKLGLEPDKDVHIQAVNSEGARMAAVQAGQICCTIAQPQDQLVLEPQGYHVLVDLSQLGLPNAQGVIATPRSYLNANKPVVQGFMNGIVDAIAAEKNDKPGSVALIKKYLKLDKDDVANVLYDYFVGKIIPANPVVSADQFADGITLLTQQNEKMKGFTMEKFIDTSVLDAAVKK